MLINGINPSVYGVTSYNKEIGNTTITTYNDWLRQSLLPIEIAQKETWKSIKLSFFLRGSTEDSVTINIGNLVSQLKKCILQFDNISFYYACDIQDYAVTKYSPLQQKVDVNLLGYAYKDYVTENLNQVSSKTINVSGNQPTPAVVTVIMPVDTVSVTLTGFGEDPIIINNLHANVPVVVDGEACTVLENGVNKYGDTDMWEFPTLQPGANTITSSSANCTINISYKPKFL